MCNIKRYCFVLELKDEFVNDYCELHRNAWPELLKAVKENGAEELLIWNYKNFSIVYYECYDIDALYKKLEDLEVIKKWNVIEEPWFKKCLPIDSEGGFETCDKIFDLNQQINGTLERY